MQKTFISGMQFLRTPEQLKGGTAQDDLLFFVLQERKKAGDIAHSPEKGNNFVQTCPSFNVSHMSGIQGVDPVLLVRRKGKAMPADLSLGMPLTEKVSWLDSVMLNLVLQTTYMLRATVCR